MRTEHEVYLRGHGLCLPARLPVADAVAQSPRVAELVARTDAVSVSVSTGASAPEMAVTAAREALAAAGSTAGDVGLILHADTWHQGQDLWNVAAFVQRETVRNHVPAIEIRQQSNGGMTALGLAADHLATHPASRDVLVTTGDRFCAPGIDRWSTDPGTPYADGGTAVVVSREPGWARLRSFATWADSDLEPLHRGHEGFSDAPMTGGSPVDFTAARKRFTHELGLSFGVSRTVAGQRRVLTEATADAGVDLADADWVVLPHFGRRRLQSVYYREFGIDPRRTTWDFSRTVGHLGAGDQFASLGHLADSGMLAVGDTCVVVGVGAGYAWSCAVLEIVDVPAAGAVAPSPALAV